MSSKIIRTFVNPYADPEKERPNYHVTIADADDRVNRLGCCWWYDNRTIVYCAREARNREDMVAAGTFREAWKQIPSGPTRIPVWQMPTKA